jgi:phosphopantothenate synthetase
VEIGEELAKISKQALKASGRASGMLANSPPISINKNTISTHYMTTCGRGNRLEAYSIAFLRYVDYHFS